MNNAQASGAIGHCMKHGSLGDFPKVGSIIVSLSYETILFPKKQTNMNRFLTLLLLCLIVYYDNKNQVHDLHYFILVVPCTSCQASDIVHKMSK